MHRQSKNSKNLIPKSQLGSLPPLMEPNQEIQMDFAGPIPFKENTQNNYILVTVDRLSRYPHAETFHNCDTETALDYLERYCKQHGIPRSVRCDQAQAYKAKQFEIFCKNKNIKLILAPAGENRGTGMVERLIQTIKRRLAVLDMGPNWSNETLSTRLASIIENIRPIPNKTTRTTPFEAHFGRKPNTKLSNIVTKPSLNNLSYKKVKHRCLDRRLLRHDSLTNEELWRRDGNSEDELDIQYKPSATNPTTPPEIDSDDSENVPLINTATRKIRPSELHFTIGDHTTKIVYNKKNIARKTIMRKAKEPRPTQASQWNIKPDGTITGYSPHTVTIDTPERKNTVIRKNDIAIATESIPLPPPQPQPPETKPRLIHIVACEIVGEYNRNQKKIRMFCLEESKAAKKAQSTSQGSSSGKEHSKRTIHHSQPKQSPAKPKAKIEIEWTKKKLVKLATHNQTRQQAKTKAPPRAQSGMLKRTFKASTPKQSFNYKAQQAALLESANIATNSKASTIQAAQPPSEVSNRSFLIFNFNETDHKNVQTHFIESDNPDSPHMSYTPATTHLTL